MPPPTLAPSAVPTPGKIDPKAAPATVPITPPKPWLVSPGINFEACC
jgi:hypothetical protein